MTFSSEVFFNEDEFAEKVTFVPSDGSAQKEVLVIVERDLIQEENQGESVFRRYQVLLQESEVQTLEVAKDKFLIPILKGYASSEEWIVSYIESLEHGVWTFFVER
ncbi:hypothetical protein AB834_00475 [PVC group bacterium (ex Bugula neritina AB1)]|nr:hypothetical protein AB834_00475 [PVC group bacterium (ex Bugula neritina AB1)]